MAETVKKGARITSSSRDKLAVEPTGDSGEVPDESAPVPEDVTPGEPPPEV